MTPITQDQAREMARDARRMCRSLGVPEYVLREVSDLQLMRFVRHLMKEGRQ
jgi:hypothetical protein